MLDNNVDMQQDLRLRLILQNPRPPEGAKRETFLQANYLTIGRSEAADWVIPDRNRIISKIHCRIDRLKTAFFVTDLSTNGTLLNKSPLRHDLPTTLSNGDSLCLGNVDFNIKIERIRQQNKASSAHVDTDTLLTGPFSDDKILDHTPKTSVTAVKNNTLPDASVPPYNWWNNDAVRDKTVQQPKIDLASNQSEVDNQELQKKPIDDETLKEILYKMNNDVLVKTIQDLMAKQPESEQTKLCQQFFQILRSE